MILDNGHFNFFFRVDYVKAGRIYIELNNLFGVYKIEVTRSFYGAGNGNCIPEYNKPSGELKVTITIVNFQDVVARNF